ncbi:MAG TPA: sigma-70 family RNA polymerase sigma factor [Thermoanaerobaculia bacterium]|jgi:RNA polymerase sigma factor for flagellar operon FliA
MSPEETYLHYLGTIERLAAFVARRNHLSRDETLEFMQEVRVRLLDDDYSIIRKFEGRANFSTYLTTVIARLFHEWRVKQWGKWRPTAEARRLGDKAIVLERMLTRDGYTFDEAVKVLTTPAGAQYTVSELEVLYVRLPPRNPRPVLVSDGETPDAAAVDEQADERVETHERERSARKAATALDELLLTLDAEDRLILQMRFWDALRVPDIARRLHLDQKKVYKRLDRLFGSLRRALETMGVSKAEVGAFLAKGDQEIHLDLFTSAGEIRPFRPSTEPGGKEVRGGEGGHQ